MIANIIEKIAGRVGISALELTRFIKFGVVGVIGAIVDFGIFNLLRWLLIPLASDGGQTVLPLLGSFETISILLAVASGISFIAAIISNFFWNRYWTYPDSRSKSLRRQFVQFFLVNFIAIFIRVPIVGATHGFFESMAHSLLSITDKTAALIGDNVALVFAVGIVMFWNFFVNRYWTYADVGKEKSKEDDQKDAPQWSEDAEFKSN